VTFVVWANLTVSPVDGGDAANAVMLQVMDQIYAVSPLGAPSGDNHPARVGSANDKVHSL
jgi:hypothetical protein